MRTIVLSPCAQDELDAAVLQHKRFDDVYRGLEWRITRDFGAGKLIPRSSPDAYIIKSRPVGELPCLMFIYRLKSQDEIEIVSARIR